MSTVSYKKYIEVDFKLLINTVVTVVSELYKYNNYTMYTMCGNFRIKLQEMLGWVKPTRNNHIMHSPMLLVFELFIHLHFFLQNNFSLNNSSLYCLKDCIYCLHHLNSYKHVFSQFKPFVTIIFFKCK